MQDSLAQELMHRSFDTSPDTVYGILVVSLMAAVVALFTLLVLVYRGYLGKMVELHTTNLGALKDVTAILDNIEQAGVVMTDTLRAEIQRTREHVSEKIESLKQNLRHE